MGKGNPVVGHMWISVTDNSDRVMITKIVGDWIYYTSVGGNGGEHTMHRNGFVKFYKKRGVQ